MYSKDSVEQNIVQKSPLFCANIVVNKDPARARQNSLATAGTNFTKLGAQNKGHLCTVGLLSTITSVYFLDKNLQFLDNLSWTSIFVA